MQFVWTAELSVGDPVIDAQHQGLFRETSELLETVVNDTPSPERVREVISFLDKYIAEHFSFEEAYMVSHGYPAVKEHKALHQNFIEHYVELKGKIDAARPTQDSLFALENFLGQWLVHHIGEEDRKYYQYIRDHLSGVASV